MQLWHSRHVIINHNFSVSLTSFQIAPFTLNSVALGIFGSVHHLIRSHHLLPLVVAQTHKVGIAKQDGRWSLGCGAISDQLSHPQWFPAVRTGDGHADIVVDETPRHASSSFERFRVRSVLPAKLYGRLEEVVQVEGV